MSLSAHMMGVSLINCLENPFPMLPVRGRDGLPHLRVGDAGLPDDLPVFADDLEGVLPRLRMAGLLRWLDGRLNRPTEIEVSSRRRTVWVFGSIGYRVDYALRRVVPLLRMGGQVLRQDYTVELLRPLSNPRWVPFILREAGLSDYGPQRPLFRADGSIGLQEGAIAEATFRRLARDERFRELRRRLLPSALALDPELLRIAHACRDRHYKAAVDSVRYSLIWRHDSAFRTAARENSRLLPLAFEAVRRGEIDPRGDLVHQLHDALRERGLPRQAWRHLAQHGVECLFPLWRRLRVSALEGTAAYLRDLCVAGADLPPARVAYIHWLRVQVGWQGMAGEAGAGVSCRAPSFVAAAYLREAWSASGALRRGALTENAPVVFEWVRAVQPQPDKLQRRAGWGWLVRKARAWNRRQTLLRHTGAREWPSVLEHFEADGLRASAIRTLEELIDEGTAFHNCLGRLAAECQSGEATFFVVRRTRTNERIAVAAVAWHDRLGAWILGNVKGPANSEVSPVVRSFGCRLAAEYGRLASAPHGAVAVRPPPAERRAVPCVSWSPTMAGSS